VTRLLRVAPVLVLTLACGGGADRGVIQNRGSDTLVNVAVAWAERYADIRPDAAIGVSGGGSGTGIAALINGTADIANASRAISEDETSDARARGVEPVEHIVGYDALAVFLHPSNPIDSLALTQLARIYGEGGDIRLWSDLGVSMPGCRSDEIVRVSRQNNSGTYSYFRDAVLGDGRGFELGSRDLNGSSEVVDLVANTPCAIGYSGLAYATEHVKMPCIISAQGGPCVPPTVSTAVDGSYPIARPLYMYTAGQPTGAVGDYIEWILSTAGQCTIFENGYAPARPVTCG
jgi:phosphate transport system substrate-binding protein